jgi:hypothetical protein
LYSSLPSASFLRTLRCNCPQKGVKVTEPHELRSATCRGRLCQRGPSRRRDIKETLELLLSVQGLQKPVCNLRPKKSGRCGPILWHGFARWVFDGTKRQEIFLSTCACASPALPHLPTYTRQPQELDLRETGTINAGGVYAKRRLKLGTKAVIIPKCVLFPSLRVLRFCQTHLCHMLRRALY